MSPAAKVFFVGDNTDAWFGDFQNEFGPDVDGAVRVFSTVASAIAACTAGRGDVILVAPSITTTITGAAGVAIATAGISIIGLGNGSDRPTFNFTTAIGASFNITAANVLIKNCIFTCSFDAITAMVNVSAADVEFQDCRFDTNNATMGAVLGILTAATATRFAVRRCQFMGPAVNAGTTTTAQIKHEVGVDYIIEDCYFTGKMTQAILNATTILRGEIRANRFVVYTGTVAITMAAASTPFITNNRFNVPSGTAPIVAAAGFVAGNIYSAAAGVTAGTASTF